MASTKRAGQQVRLKQSTTFRDRTIPKGWHGEIISEIEDNGVGIHLISVNWMEDGSSSLVRAEELDFGS